MTTESKEPTYKPFPGFVDWSRMDVSVRDADDASKRFEELKNAASVEVLDAALDHAHREAAVDTNAIEGVFETDRGFTTTVALRTGTWEQMMDEKGPHVRPAFEDALAGFEYILDAMTGSTPITERWIRELHAVMLHSQQTHRVRTEHGMQDQELARGEYKRQPNSPNRPDGTVHAYASVEETAPEMGRLIKEINSVAFQEAHPVLQAAYGHFALVCIHPFADGNGRIARALASVYLYRGPGVPLVIYQDQRRDYIQALEAADLGESRLLVRFISERVTDTIYLVSTELTRPVSARSGSERLAELLKPTRAMPELQGLMVRLSETMHSELRAQLDRQAKLHSLPFKAHRSLIGTTAAVPEGYMAFGDDMGVTLALSISSPRKVFRTLNVLMLAREGADATSDLLALTNSGYRLDVSARDLDPTVTESLRARVRVYAEGVIDLFLEQVAEAFAE